MNDKELFAVVGLPYYQFDVVRYLMCPGQILTLIEEPNNKYDKNAIEVFFSNYKIGYIEKDYCKMIKKLKVSSIVIYCLSLDINPIILCHILDEFN